MSYDDSSMRLLFVASVLAPYRRSLLAQISRDIKSIRVMAAFTSGERNGGWSTDEIGFGAETVWLPAVEFPNRDWLASPWGSLKRLRKLVVVSAQVVESERPHLVILHGYSSPAALLIARECFKRGIPTYLRADSNILGEANKSKTRLAAKKLLLRWFLRRMSGVLPVGERGIQYFSYYGVSESDMTVVPFEPDYGFYASGGEADTANACRKYNLNASHRYLMFSGRLAPEKRVDLLLSAFDTVAVNMPTWHLIIAGDGPLEDELRAQVPERIEDRVHFLGRCTPNELKGLYNLGEVLVLPSDRESWGIVVNEGIACGLIPIVSSAVGSAIDLIVDGVNGFVFRAGDESGLAEAILMVSRDEEAERIRAASASHFKAYRSRRNAVKSVESLLVQSQQGGAE